MFKATMSYLTLNILLKVLFDDAHGPLNSTFWYFVNHFHDNIANHM
jgi:hypothetical protein